MVVRLVPLLQSTEDTDRILLARLIDHHDLEAPLECPVGLKVLLILTEGRGTDDAELAPGESRLEEVGGIHGALALARTDEGVDLIDEEDHLSIGAFHLVDDALESLLKLALILRSGNQRPHVKGVKLLVPKVLRHIAPHDTAGKALGDGGLADARLTDQDRVILRPAAEYLQHTPYLIVPTDHRVELALASRRHEIGRVLIEGVVGLLRGGGVRLGPLAKRLHRLEHRLIGDALILKSATGGGVGLEERQEEVLHRDILIAHLGSDTLRCIEHRGEVPTEVRLPTLHLREATEVLLDPRP